MTERELIEYCLTFADAHIRYPFGEGMMVLTINERNGFCYITEGSDPLHINLKCDPMEATFLRSVYKSVKPGYHFNKTHWNSVYLDGTVPDNEIKYMVTQSYLLVKAKNKTRLKY